jgi:uncharacterized membrane protein YbhN (UPF0104 family)
MSASCPTDDRPTTRVADGAQDGLPDELASGHLVRRLVTVVALLAVLVLIAVLSPGLGEVRARLSDAEASWLVVAVAFEALSGMSYVLMFRQIFCAGMSRRTAWEISWSELAVGSIVPASGAGGVALGAWILHRTGMRAERIARRSVAFLIVKSAVNFVAVLVLGIVMAAGLLGPGQPLWLTALPAALSAVAIGLVIAVPHLGPGEDPGDGAARLRRGVHEVRRAIIDGAAGAVEIVRARDARVLIGAIGYWAWDNAVLWATFHAVGVSVPISVVLMGYLIGQLGGALPLPGGVGGIDGGLIGTLVVYGAPAAPTAAAVLAYRLVLFWLPLLVGAPAFISLRRRLDDIGSPADRRGAPATA